MGVRPSPPLLALMGVRLEGLIPAATLPLLLTMVLFLGPLIQLAMDCPWDFMDGLKVGIDPRFWALCFSDCLCLCRPAVLGSVDPRFWALCFSDCLCLCRPAVLGSVDPRFWALCFSDCLCLCRPAVLGSVDLRFWALWVSDCLCFCRPVVLGSVVTVCVCVSADPRFWALCFSDMRWLRNQVVAPLTEELVFRACMLPMLVPCAGPTRAIFTCPLFFGVAHFHHVIELLRFRQGTVLGIFLSAVFQFSYTAVFGAYTAFIFIRTGHLVGPVLCHSFCNHMGFPALSAALDHPQRLFLLGFYLLGVLLFLLLLFPLTDPLFYGAAPVCSLAPSPRALCS
ncbi:FACE2 protease, partial [Atractosteus spatula]|nr:FACE2 protease [Atractosteus spatula]